MWLTELAKYHAAQKEHARAVQLEARAARTFDKLAKRIGDERAYLVAGCAVADERSIHTYRRCSRAYETLRMSLPNGLGVARIIAAAAVRSYNAAHEHRTKRPANDNTGVAMTCPIKRDEQ